MDYAITHVIAYNQQNRLIRRRKINIIDIYNAYYFENIFRYLLEKLKISFNIVIYNGKKVII